MKKMRSLFLYMLVLITVVAISCKKDETRAVYIQPAGITDFKASANAVVLSPSNDSTTVVNFTWQAADYGIKIIPTYTLQFDLPSDTSGANAWGNAINMNIDNGKLEKAFLGTNFNSLLATQLGMPVSVTSTLAVRLRVAVNQSSGTASVIPNVYKTITLQVTPYKALVVYPALMVKGGNSWNTPAVRTDGYILTSVKYNNLYEGYLNLPNADGYGGDAFQLVSTTDSKVYGWGGTATTMAIGGGNLWLTPSPAYMKVNADITAGTINFVPVKFYISGDDNGWSTSATPMTFDAASKTWIANNVSLTAGKVFVFTCNGGYDISYKVDKDGKLVYAGAPTWVGNNIPVSKTGVFKVTLDLSQGDGNYTFSVK